MSILFRAKTMKILVKVFLHKTIGCLDMSGFIPCMASRLDSLAFLAVLSVRPCWPWAARSVRALVVVIDARLEHALVHAANRAAPVIGQILESGSGSDAMLGIAFFRIISVSTGIAEIFFHVGNLLSRICIYYGCPGFAPCRFLCGIMGTSPP